MYKEIKIMEDLEKFFEERERRDRKLKMIIELSISEIEYPSPSFIFPEPENKPLKKVKITQIKKDKNESDLF
jgi:hypothetical protein